MHPADCYSQTKMILIATVYMCRCTYSVFSYRYEISYYRKVNNLSSDSDFDHDRDRSRSPIYIHSDEENSEREDGLGNERSFPQATIATDCVSKYMISLYAHEYNDIKTCKFRILLALHGVNRKLNVHLL